MSSILDFEKAICDHDKVKEAYRLAFLNRPQLGYLGIEGKMPVGYAGQWRVLTEDGLTSSRNQMIQRGDDREGWYEHITREPKYYPENKVILEQTITHHVKANIRFIYLGDDPKYAAFK